MITLSLGVDTLPFEMCLVRLADMENNCTIYCVAFMGIFLQVNEAIFLFLVTLTTAGRLLTVTQ